MAQRKLACNSTRTDSGWDVCSTSVGTVHGLPEVGSWVSPGAPIGRLEALNDRFVLLAPADCGGVVRVRAGGRDRALSVGFGDRLLELEPLSEGAIDPTEESSEAQSGLGVVAPTDGVFYCRASPEAEPFVQKGSKLSAGVPVGLIEVMKTFNQIVYDADELPATAEVEEVLVKDGQEVQAGQLLIRLKG